MSLGYAEKLSYREDVGTVGMSEIFDPPDALQQKGKDPDMYMFTGCSVVQSGNTGVYSPLACRHELSRTLKLCRGINLVCSFGIDTENLLLSPVKIIRIEQLAMMIHKSKHLVVFTGAGVSTSCGIPDFRGPKGIWTLQREGKGVPEASLPFDRAMPSITHVALVELEKAGILKFVISQNVDSLHLRSGIPREKLAELHGNSFMEICPKCRAEYLRDFEVETIGLKETSRRCSDVNCGAKLKDTVLDWEVAYIAIKSMENLHSNADDSMNVVTFDALPPKEMNAAERHCRMADIVLCLGTSLQITPACNLPLKCLRLGGKIVIVNLQLPDLKEASHPDATFLADSILRCEMVSLVGCCPGWGLYCHFTCNAEKKYAKWTLRVSSVHGERAQVPFIKSIEVSFPGRPKLKEAVLHQQPFVLKRESLKTTPLKVCLKLNFSDGCGCLCTNIEVPINFRASLDNFNQDKNTVTRKLRDTAIQDQRCGQFLVVEKRIQSNPKREMTVYAVATNMVRYDGSLSSSHFSEARPESKYNLLKMQDDMIATEVPVKKQKIH
ncbi:hypothetical protein RHSIM_Rhsim06G0177100 [Rhododendron simsii]|uniref:NAD-dependent protein deacetylase SRT1 n=1 Tax=Rhododendron simsii TaxID=118357 RepID=A0A834LLR7_RHOSS|nr:hypothetical protein RHSIM_Rhsim06G0177100 [Rhododendron simsii]